MLGGPGYLNCSKMEWFEGYSGPDDGFGDECGRDGDRAGTTWYSYDAYQEWQDDDRNASFSGVVFDVEDDRGDIGYSYSGGDLYCEINRWNLDSFEEYLEISLPYGIDPNLSSLVSTAKDEQRRQTEMYANNNFLFIDLLKK